MTPNSSKAKFPARGGLPEVDAYFARLEPKPRADLERVREAIQSIVPGAKEVLRYGMPAFILNGQSIVYYAAWKNHTAIYGLGAAVLDQYASELAGYRTPKEALKIPIDARLPSALIKELIKARLKELNLQ